MTRDEVLRRFSSRSPVMRDVNLRSKWYSIPPEHVSHYDSLTIESDAKNGAALPNHIYLDAMAFGGSCCCLQVTVQGHNIDQARRIYDAMVPLAPIMVRSLFC